MFDKGSALKSPSKEMWASPANSSIMANNKRRLSLTCQNLPALFIDESYHRHPFRFSCQAFPPQILVNAVIVHVKSSFRLRGYSGI